MSEIEIHQHSIGTTKRIGKDGVPRKMPERKAKPVKVSAKQLAVTGPHKSAPSKRIALLSDEACTDCTTQQERWHRSLSNMAGEAILLPAYWTQQFGKDWQTFEVSSDVLTLAKLAAEAWNDIVENLINRKEGQVK
jgi:hypothetical protein